MLAEASFKSAPGADSAVAAESKAGIMVSPNPVENKTMHIVCANMPSGKYMLTIYDAAGTLVLHSDLDNGSKNQLHTVPLKNMAAGAYRVTVSGTGGSYEQEIIVR